jgi:hypothetical protein
MSNKGESMNTIPKTQRKGFVIAATTREAAQAANDVGWQMLKSNQWHTQSGDHISLPPSGQSFANLSRRYVVYLVDGWWKRPDVCELAYDLSQGEAVVLTMRGQRVELTADLLKQIAERAYSPEPTLPG